MEELLASSYMFGYAYISYLFFYIPHLICLFTSFLLALTFVFSKTKMFKLLFILFVIKQLLGNLLIRYLFSQAKYYPTRES